MTEPRYVTISLVAPEIRDGDLYRCEGFPFEVSDVRHLSDRTAWTATWTGEGRTPGAGYEKFTGSGNHLRTLTVLRREVTA